MKKVFCFFLILTFLAASGAFAAESKAKGTLIVGIASEPINLDPATAFDSSSLEVCSSIYENLVKLDKRTHQIIPQLAVWWQSSSDFKIWTFKLRKGVYFQDGALLDSQAVKFNFQRQFDLRDPFHYPTYGHFSFWSAVFEPGSLKKINILNRYEFQLIFSRSFPNLLEILAWPNLALVSPKAVKKYKNSYYKHPVGTGPFKLLQWRENRRLVLEQNNKYWKQKPYLRRVILEPLASHAYRLSLFQKNHLNVMCGIQIDDEIKLKKNRQSFKVLSTPKVNHFFLLFNCSKEPFINYRLRQVAGLALDISILEQMHLFRPTLEPLDYKFKNVLTSAREVRNLTKAKKLLKLAGFPDGLKADLVFSESSDLYISNIQDVADKLTFLLELYNIKIKLRPCSYKRFCQKIKEGDYQLALFWTDTFYQNKNFFYFTFFDQRSPLKYGNNKCVLKDSKLAEILDKLSRSFYADRQKYLQEELADFIKEEICFIKLANLEKRIICTPDIKNLRLNEYNYLDFTKVRFQ